MTVANIKIEMLDFIDFYGWDIPDREAIQNCKTKYDCYLIMKNHKRLMEDTLIDAFAHLDQFMKRCGIYNEP